MMQISNWGFLNMLESARSTEGRHSARRLLARCTAAGMAIMLAAQPVIAAPFPSANPEVTAQAKRMITAYRAWAKRWSVPNGDLAVMTGTKLTGTTSFGNYGPAKIEPVASESKAITAVCIARLVDAKKLAFDTKLKTVLKSYFAKNKPADARIPAITIANLLTHSSGMTYDPSQGGPIEQQLPFNKTNLQKQTKIAFETALGAEPGAEYFYNNMNYAVLGFVIETITGQQYENYCGRTVLKPVGVTDAVLNPPWRIMASWGGWKISAEDYARFLEYFLPSEHLLKTSPAKWPQFSLGGGAYYSLGTLLRQNGSGYNFWHEGSWQWNGTPQASFGAYFTVITENVRYMAEYSPTISDDAASDLDSSMYAAATANSNATGPTRNRRALLTH